METTDAERALPLVRGERLSGHVLALNARKSEIIS